MEPVPDPRDPHGCDRFLGRFFLIPFSPSHVSYLFRFLSVCQLGGHRAAQLLSLSNASWSF
jgi:hypothetical protein